MAPIGSIIFNVLIDAHKMLKELGVSTELKFEGSYMLNFLGSR
jgi:hypothetical protein